MIPEEIKADITRSLKNENFEITDFRPASGGCINNGGRLKTSEGDFFVKWNSSSRFPEMFSAEAKGLEILAEPAAIRIPQVTSTGKVGDYEWILMEHIESSAKGPDYWTIFGEQLATLHKNEQDQYGLDHNNYIGSLPQNNEPLDNWVEFLIIRRYKPMIQRARDTGEINESIVADFEKLFQKLNDLLVYSPPGLIHGDLWGGNLMTGEKGEPVLIDPAVYYSNHEIELAFTTLFGGFDREFYRAYMEVFPLEGGYQDRFDIYNLYPLMVHVNLFGGGYLSQVKQILRRFV